MTSTFVPPTTPPQSEHELIQRCANIAGLTFKELAMLAGVAMPENLQRHKGWPGQLVELWLGANAGSKPQQDFPHLGIELKTIPIDSHFNPLETTYVCFAHTPMPAGVTWQTSSVRNKLARVLWLPIEGDRNIPLGERRIGMGFVWTPDAQQDAVLQADWEMLCELITLGEIDKITSKLGDALHIRPKAANGKVTVRVADAHGQSQLTRPRGFYLRKSFTQTILQAQLI